MEKKKKEENTVFAEVVASAPSYHQNRGLPPADNRPMLYFQGIKIYVPDDFHEATLLRLLQVLKKL